MQENLKAKRKTEDHQNVDRQGGLSLKFRELLYKIFSFVKESWHIIIFISFSCMVLISIKVYTELFSGDLDIAIKFTQEYYLNNLYSTVLHFCMYVIFFTGLIVSLSRIVSYEDIEGKNIFGTNKDIKGLKELSIGSCLLRSLKGGVYFTATVFIVSSLTNMFIFKSFLHGVRVYAEIFIFTFLLIIVLNFLSVQSIKSAHKVLSSFETKNNFYKIIIFLISRKTIFFFCALLVSLLTVLFPALSIGSYGAIDVAYRKGYISCMSSEDGSSSEKGIPISYDSRGVNIFTGDYYLDESLEYFNGENMEKGYRWRNVHRKYLQLEKGYKVTSGVCESPSVHPSQG